MAFDDLVNEINSGEERQRAERDEFVVDGLSVPAASAQATDTSRFEQKLTIGDYSKDSDQLMSSWILSNFVGGAMIDEHTEGATDQRFRIGEAWTLNPGQLALPPQQSGLTVAPGLDPAVDTDANGQVTMPLAEIVSTVYLALGKEIWQFGADAYTMTGAAYGPVVPLNGWAQGPAALAPDEQQFFVPLGEDGVDLFGTHMKSGGGAHTILAHDATVKALKVVTWDEKVWAITTDGYLRVWHPTTGWDAARRT